MVLHRTTEFGEQYLVPRTNPVFFGAVRGSYAPSLNKPGTPPQQVRECVCACVRACVRACVCVCVCVRASLASFTLLPLISSYKLDRSSHKADRSPWRTGDRGCSSEMRRGFQGARTALARQGKHTHARTHARARARAHTHTHTHTLSLCLSLSLSVSLCLSLSLSEQQLE